jgi:hypothetical protein
MPEPASRPSPPSLPAPPEDRLRLAAALRRDREDFGRALSERLRPCWRATDHPLDCPAGVVEAECGRLAGVLAVCLEMDDPRLLADSLDWLARFLSARGYDPGPILRALLDACAEAARPLAPPALLAAALAPLLDAARAAVPPAAPAPLAADAR